MKQTIAMIVGISLAIVATKSLDLTVKTKAKLFVNKSSLVVSIILIFINQPGLFMNSNFVGICVKNLIEFEFVHFLGSKFSAIGRNISENHQLHILSLIKG